MNAPPERAFVHRPYGSDAPRSWFCRGCGTTAHGPMVPPRWLTVRRHTGERDLAPERHGVYCSFRCVADVAALLAEDAA